MALGRIPWDIVQIRDWIKTLIAKLKLNIPQDNSEELFTMAVALTAAVKKTFYEKSEIKFSGEPAINKKAVIQFEGRMRIDAMEKFNKTTVFSVVHLYGSSHDMDNGQSPLGTLVLYLPKTSISELLRMLQYPYVDIEDEDAVRDGCGAVLNLIAGHFKRELILLGYQDMEMSHFVGYINYAMNGVEYPDKQLNKYETVFEIDKQKCLVVEMVMGDIRRR